jgi:hypothetical protein
MTLLSMDDWFCQLTYFSNNYNNTYSFEAASGFGHNFITRNGLQLLLLSRMPLQKVQTLLIKLFDLLINRGVRTGFEYEEF